MQTMMRTSAKAPVASTSRPSRASTVRVNARAGNWLPGSPAPAWLPDSAAGNFGFDPLGLASDTASFNRFQESELIHCRWAMLGAAGVIAVELLGFGNWADAPKWAITGGKPTWFGAEIPFDLNTLAFVEFVGFAVSEGLRNEEKDQEKKCYPGFDPMGLAKDAAKVGEWRLKEVKNGRLAMMACLGFLGQHAATGKGPLAALGEHLANPWGANFATNGVSLPF